MKTRTVQTVVKMVLFSYTTRAVVEAEERWACSHSSGSFALLLELESYLASAIKMPPGQATLAQGPHEISRFKQKQRLQAGRVPSVLSGQRRAPRTACIVL